MRILASLGLALLVGVARAQLRWEQATPAGNPPARYRHAATFDPLRGRTVVFGGEGLAGATLGDTWEFDGTAWIERTPAGAPPARQFAALAFDAARGRSLLMGGQAGFTIFADTWEWDGLSWTRRTPATAIPARNAHCMAYDSDRGRIVLFGGAPTVGLPTLNDTWEWDGTDWTLRTPPASPPARRHAAMVYDWVRRRTLLFGGLNGNLFLNDTWEWDGTTWSQPTPPTSPLGRFGHAMVYDSSRGRALLFGGSAPSSLSDTWEWDGATWVLRWAGRPSVRSGHTMAQDSVRGRTVLFGGGPVAGTYLSDTWEYLGPTCEMAGPGHPGGGLPLPCGTIPRIGTTWCPGFSHPPPTGAGFGLLAIGAGGCFGPPLSLTPPGVCAPALLYLLPIGVLQAIGNPLVFCVPIPSSPGLVGTSFCVQGAALEVGVCFRLTDALTLTVRGS